MANYWETSFKEGKEMWGLQPAPATLLVQEFFIENKIKNILIPGIGYGRNAQIFLNQGINVTGIEISKTAIELAHQHFGERLIIHHGSVTDMPFDENFYDGIYCYALIHLLDKKDREKLIHDCYQQLNEDGYMIFATVTKAASIYGQGNYIEKDRFEVFGGLHLFFYDIETIKEEFKNVGLIEIVTVNDIYPFYLIKCQKKKN